MKRPSEFITATIGTIVGAVWVIIAAVRNPESADETIVRAAIVTLLSYFPALVTWWTARKQRAGELLSANDGSVKS